MRKLVRANPQTFIDLLLAQLGSQRRVRFTGHQRPEKLKDWPLEVDTLVDIEVDEDHKKGTIHFEFQTYYDATMPERLLTYNVLVRREVKRPVLSCVLHLLKDTRIKPPPLLWTEPITGNVVQFEYVAIEIGDLLPEEIFARGEPTLLPFIPLTNGGATRENVQKMLDKLSAKNHKDFALVGFTLALATFDKSNNLSDREWLIERYKHMNSMLHDLLNEDPLYQSIMHKGEEQGIQRGIQRGIQQGIQQGLQQAAVDIVVTRFPQLESLAMARITALDNLERLQRLIIELTLSRSQDEIEQILRSLDADKTTQ